MPRGFIVDYSLLSFNSRIATRIFHGRAKALLRSAVAAWIREAESKIPVWSGMSQGSLVKIAGLVGVQISQFGQVKPTARPPYGPGSRWSEGESESTARLIQLPGRYGFRWSTTSHLAVNENVNVNELYGFNLIQPGPYKFRQAADAAFTAEMKKGLSKFPWRVIVGDSFKIKHAHMG